MEILEHSMLPSFSGMPMHVSTSQCKPTFCTHYNVLVVEEEDKGGVTTKVKAKDCSTSCAAGSMNLGILMMSSECCSSDLCNVQDTADPGTGSLNGNTCYSCDGNSCSNVLKCSGSEDRCIKATGTFSGQTTVVKGCASKSICDATSVSSVQGISCCSGNLCNGAKSVTQSFLILCFPLIAFILML
ncbi:urokinase plasminogen activator surface receptor-like [Danio aesculapii]|uniref:urokinase plasminogen activator surface receptor-like n=1 Tax=Danio aesculapii TaxID=1142201 RepID=UPI0024BFBFB3|nr:urokinase plasminogen activator surface receptor-like [Danio aesculapii]